MSEKLYKVLNRDGTPYFGGSGQWHLPTDRPGAWMPAIKGLLNPCWRGYHLCRKENLIYWLGPAIFVAEYSGERRDTATKVVVRRARLLYEITTWNEQSQRLFACDCVEEAMLHMGDTRLWEAIDTARSLVFGAVTREQANIVRNQSLGSGSPLARAVSTMLGEREVWQAADAAAGIIAQIEVDKKDYPGSTERVIAWRQHLAVAQEWQAERLFKYLENEQC